MCTLYYLFRENSAYNTHSKLVRSLEVRLEVKSLCGTSTDVSKLVCRYFNRKETRVFIHPRSKGQCRPIAWKFSFQKLKLGTSTKYVLGRSRLKFTGNLDENLKSLNQFLSKAKFKAMLMNYEAKARSDTSFKHSKTKLRQWDKYVLKTSTTDYTNFNQKFQIIQLNYYLFVKKE